MSICWQCGRGRGSGRRLKRLVPWFAVVIALGIIALSIWGAYLVNNWWPQAGNATDVIGWEGVCFIAGTSGCDGVTLMPQEHL